MEGSRRKELENPLCITGLASAMFAHLRLGIPAAVNVRSLAIAHQREGSADFGAGRLHREYAVGHNFSPIGMRGRESAEKKTIVCLISMGQMPRRVNDRETNVVPSRPFFHLQV